MAKPLNCSIGSEVKRQSFTLASLVSLVIFLIFLIFLFSVKVQQRQYAITKKFEIDNNLVLNSLEIGDLFFITQYLNAFVKSSVVDFVGIHISGSADWVVASRRTPVPVSELEPGFKLRARSIQFNGNWQLDSKEGASWTLQYSYRINYLVFFWPLLLSIIVAIIIFSITKILLTSAAYRISNPIEALSRDLERQKKLVSKKLHLYEYSNGLRFDETDSFVRTLQEFLTKIMVQQEEIKDIEIYKTLGQISRQVNHDIQSPVGALKVAVNGLSQEHGAQKSLIEKAVRRIEAIAADLAKAHMKPGGIVGSQLGKVDLKSLVQDIVHEKLIEFKSKNVKISIKSNLKELMWDIDSHEFSRAISNIVNNGVEATNDNGAEIQISLGEENENRYIEIEDNGKGIPKELENKIFEYGFTSGKEKGTGLGLYYARSIFEKSGAQLTYKKVPKGSGFRISFPKENS